MSMREDAFKLANAAARMEDQNKVMREALKVLKHNIKPDGSLVVNSTEIEQLIGFVEAGIGEKL